MTAPSQVRKLLARGPKYYLVLGLWTVGLTVALLLLTLIDTRVAPVPLYLCPPDCGRPPTGLPVSTNPRFTASDGAFSVSIRHPGPPTTSPPNPMG